MKKLLICFLMLVSFPILSCCETIVSYGDISIPIPDGFKALSMGYMNEARDNIFVFGSEDDPSSYYSSTGECIDLLRIHADLLDSDDSNSICEIVGIDECAALVCASSESSGYSISITVMNGKSFAKVLIGSDYEENALSHFQYIYKNMKAKEAK